MKTSMSTAGADDNTHNYDKIKNMYNDLAIEFNDLQEQYETMDDAARAMGSLLVCALQFLKTQSKSVHSTDLAALIKKTEDAVHSHSLTERPEDQNAAYDALFFKERKAIEKCREELRLAREQSATLKTEGICIAAKNQRMAALLEETTQNKKALEGKLAQKQSEIAAASTKLQQECDKIKDVQEKLKVFAVESQSVQDILATKKMHLHELKASVQVELNKMLHFKTENKTNQERNRISRITQGIIPRDVEATNTVDTESEQTNSTKTHTQVNRDAIGRIVVVDGMSRMTRSTADAHAIAPKAPKTPRSLDFHNEGLAVSKLEKQAFYVSELLLEVEKSLKIILSFSDLD